MHDKDFKAIVQYVNMLKDKSKIQKSESLSHLIVEINSKFDII